MTEDTSVIQAIWRMTKAIKSSRMRDEVREATDSLASSELGYRGRRRNKQFAGYLELSEASSSLSKSPLVSDLAAPTRSVLQRAHAVIAWINTQLLVRLAQHSAFEPSICDPYAELKELNEAVVEADIEPLWYAAAERLADAFAQSESMAIVRKVQGQIPEEALLATIEFIDGALNSGERERLNDLQALFLTHEMGAAHGIAALASAVLSCRSTFAIVDQLIFQAFCDDELLLIDENVVIEHPTYSRHISGTDHKVVLVPEGRMIHASPGQVVLFRPGLRAASALVVCRLRALHLTVSPDTGAEMKLDLMEVNEDASELGTLVESASTLLRAAGVSV